MWHVVAHTVSGRWRNHLEGVSGRLVRPLPPAEAVPEGPKRRRSVRYVHLNPCRARLVADPLAWPLSTHRDVRPRQTKSLRRPASRGKAQPANDATLGIER